MESFVANTFIDYIFRWMHVLFGITWIGLLYYLNFVQTEWLKEIDASFKNNAISKLVPRVLWWFRWAAMFTFISGLVLLSFRSSGITTDITIGATLGTLMLLNVWLIIWPNQKIVISSANSVLAGEKPIENVASCLAKSSLASRTNTLFSIPMLFFMGSSAHFPNNIIINIECWLFIGIFGLILLLELNAIFGKLGPLTTIKGVISCGFLLTAILFGISNI